MDWQKILDTIDNWWNITFVKVFVSTLVFLLLWWIVSAIIKKIKKNALKHDKVDKLVTSVLFNCILWIARIILIVIYASIVGIDMAGFAAIVSSAVVALGLALQGSLSNLAGGIVIVLTRPFKIGDRIEAQGTVGDVEDVRMFYTYVITPDNKVVMIPNGVLANGVIINYSKKDIRRVDLLFSISYDDNVEKAISVIKNICEKHNLILKNPAIFVSEERQANSSVDITVRAWCNTGDYWTVYYDLIRNVHQAFDENGITIPYPQIDVHQK